MQSLLELCIVNLAARNDIDTINYLLQLEGFERCLYKLLTKYQRRDLLGDWEKYYEDGTLRSRRTYIDYNHYELTRWRKDGSIIEKCYYLDDKLHGVCHKWHANGKKRIVARYKHGKLYKSYKKYYSTGQIAKHVTNGGIINVVSYDTYCYGLLYKPSGHTVKWYMCGQIKKVYDFYGGYVGAYIHYDVDGSLIKYAYFVNNDIEMQIYRNIEYNSNMQNYTITNGFNSYHFDAFEDNIDTNEQKENKDRVWNDHLIDDLSGNTFTDDEINIDDLSNDEINIDELLKLI
ncbi:MORN repeat protein [Pacmanvirus A23]|uniref:MORN repeat protein n=1 Tax=Pacmanvirus A23 TaxID=1932881 RepID=UPI000A0946EE|nr:MORN repeat protein [Pacmanvirus A23]SIP85997.1 MORN repeat protein [Pacmanvirus A23]